MQLANMTITCFIPHYELGELVHDRVVISGVSIHKTASATVTTNGLKSADTVTIRIPAESILDEYVDHQEYEPGMLAIKDGMTICLDEVEDLPIDQLIEKYGRGKVKTVVSHTENLRGMQPHIKVVLT